MIHQLHPIHAVASAVQYVEDKLSSGVTKIRAIFSQIFTNAPTRQAEQFVKPEAAAHVFVAEKPQSSPSCPEDAFARLTPLQQLDVQSEEANEQYNKAFDAASNNLNDPKVKSLRAKALEATAAYDIAMSPYGINFPKDHYEGISDYKKFVKEFNAQTKLHSDHIANLQAIRDGR